tara:strand:+ start:171 stop:563 length:393 start_codon:yes stop_codon:yes gene_type:complete
MDETMTRIKFSFLALLSCLYSKAALAVSLPQGSEDSQIIHTTDLAITPREGLLATAFIMIICICLAGFALRQRISGRTVLALLMLCLFISAYALIFLFGSSYGEKEVFGLGAVISMLILFKLMNQFEINK